MDPHSDELAKRIAATSPPITSISDDSHATLADHGGKTRELNGGNSPLSSQACIGPYEILEVIGRGGMGIVYKARHRAMKRLVALKTMPESAHASPEAAQRFERELDAVARLSHPNIVTAYDVLETSQGRVLVMEYVEGKDLSCHIREHGPLDVPTAVRLILQVARALEYAHSHGIIHRDIKPANLLLSKDGDIKVLDLGLARMPAAEEAIDLTNTGQILGTVDYMAPEQAINTKRADQRSDVYSLGCTLYFLIVGKPPFDGATAMERIIAHREQSAPSLRSVSPRVSPALDTVFQRMIAKRPEDRWQSMSDFIAAIEKCALPTATKDRPATSRRASWLIAGTAAGLLAAVLLIARLRSARDDGRRPAIASTGNAESKQSDKAGEQFDDAGRNDGSVTNALRIIPEKVISMPVGKNEVLSDPRFVLMYAGDGSQDAIEDQGGSFFYQSLIAGLKGKADVEADGQVTIDELQNYVSRETATLARFAGRAQIPQLRCDDRLLNLVFATCGEGATTSKDNSLGIDRALFVVAGNYPGWLALSSPTKDALQLRAVLESKGWQVTAFVADSNDESTDTVALWAEIERLVNVSNPTDRLLISFFGHTAIVNERGYYLPANAGITGLNPDTVRAYGIPLNQVVVRTMASHAGAKFVWIGGSMPDPLWNEPTSHEIASLPELVQMIEKFLRQRSHEESIALGSFTTPSQVEPNIGRRLRNLLAQEITNSGIRVDRLAQFECKGEVQAVAGKRFARLSAICEIVEAKSRRQIESFELHFSGANARTFFEEVDREPSPPSISPNPNPADDPFSALPNDSNRLSSPLGTALVPIAP